MTLQYEKELTIPECDTLAKMLTRAINRRALLDEVHEVMSSEEAQRRDPEVDGIHSQQTFPQ